MSNASLVGRKFRDLHSLRRSRVVTVLNDYSDFYGDVMVESNRGRTTFINANRLLNRSRFLPVKTRKGN